jgi:ABC-2 type transport system permease protein
MINTTTQPNTAAQEQALRWKENLITLRIATWLGWQVESNWADPFVFFVFTILRPMASALIVVVMYQVIAGGTKGDYFTYLFVSNAFFVLVTQTMAGMAWAIFDDRENYRMLKYIYTSPARKFAYLIGRAVAKVVIGMVTVVILLATGLLFLGLQVNWGQVEWGWMLAYFFFGMMGLAGLGIVMAGVALVVARHGASIGEVTAGMLLLFCGALFPPDVLPVGLKQVSLVLPPTYWLEGMRRALNGGILMGTHKDASGQLVSGPIAPSLAQFDNWQLLLIVAATGLISAAGSFFFYRWVEHQAKERGMIDRLTGY